MNIEELKEYATLTAAKRAHKAELEVIQDRLDELEQRIFDEMVQDGVSTTRVEVPDGTFTLYPYSRLWARAKDGDYEAACRWLKRIGWGDLVEKKFNTNKMSATMRELVANEHPFPKGYQKYLEVTEDFKIGVKRINGK